MPAASSRVMTLAREHHGRPPWVRLGTKPVLPPQAMPSLPQDDPALRRTFLRWDSWCRTGQPAGPFPAVLLMTTPSTWPQSPRSGTSTAKAAATSTASSPKARPARKRSGASSGRSATSSTPAWWPAPPPAARPPKLRAREGNRGTALSPARPAHTPGTGSSDKPLRTTPQPTTGRPGPAGSASDTIQELTRSP